ncbi:MAG: hypothetical protein LBT46_03770 [Planctomycetaceae bacterium]|nr:hypothetical protein [Planctomycetaceae bacterium]
METVEIGYKKNVMADMKWTHEWTADAAKPNKEFLFLLENDKVHIVKGENYSAGRVKNAGVFRQICR